jgi:hypothetical protein
MLMLAKLSDHDWDPSNGILEGIDYEPDVKLIPNSLVGSASKKN